MVEKISTNLHRIPVYSCCLSDDFLRNANQPKHGRNRCSVRECRLSTVTTLLLKMQMQNICHAFGKTAKTGISDFWFCVKSLDMDNYHADLKSNVFLMKKILITTSNFFLVRRIIVVIITQCLLCMYLKKGKGQRYLLILDTLGMFI